MRYAILLLTLLTVPAWGQTSGTTLLQTRPAGSGGVAVDDISTYIGGVYKITNMTAVKTVATLPTCTSALEGAWAFISDATTPTYNATLTGGGAVHVPVYCNGTAWTSH